MDLESVRVFVRVAELGNFTRASQQLGLSKARASIRVQELEAELGCRLLHRSTRAMRLTEDGAQFLVRAKRLVSDADELASMFQAPSTLRGRVRLDLPIGFARNVVIPRLPEFFAQHPQVEMLVSTTDQRVDLVREGFDCVLRVGALADSSLVARRLGVLTMVNCASPAYLRKYGTPENLHDLAQHFIVHYSLTFGADAPSFEYKDGNGYRELPMQSTITVNSSDAYTAAAVAGLGIIQSPRMAMVGHLAAGTLLEVLTELPCRPMPVSLVQVQGKQARAATRAVMAWLSEVMAPHLF